MPGRKLDHSKIFVIAEAGVNHNGSMALAYRLIDAATRAGADAVKFQTFVAENVISRYAPKAEYQLATTAQGESQLEMARQLQFTPEQFCRLKAHCARRGIMFLSTPFDLVSVGVLKKMGLGIFKIPSGEITNLPYLRKVGAIKKRVILSSGMSTIAEVRRAVSVLESQGTLRANICVLHCTTEYPAPYEDANLLAIPAMKRALRMEVGFSDHTPGIVLPLAAVALGASVIEKHFTLDQALPGPDHKASLSVEELGEMVRAIRIVECALGDGRKIPAASEIKNMPIARKSIIAACAIGKGERLTEENLTVKRPGTGISPMLWDKVIGRKAVRDFQEDELVHF
ncbi:MAG: N-acetylneuraminate synthase [Candidatus Omnitrophica bacterium]|nr:N-acetylneuraminate synthase [Candidatus Omnitrophota bacterium]